MPDAPFAGAALIWFQYGEFMNKEDCCIVWTIKPCMQTGQFTIELRVRVGGSLTVSRDPCTDPTPCPGIHSTSPNPEKHFTLNVITHCRDKVNAGCDAYHFACN